MDVDAQTQLLLEDQAAYPLQETLLWVVGDDAGEWLQGQVTADLRSLGDGNATRALIVNTQGRIMVDPWVLREGNRFALFLPSEQVKRIRAHLDAYVIMEDVELREEKACIWAWAGPAAPAGPADRLGIGGHTRLEMPPARAVEDEAWHRARVHLGVAALGIDFAPDAFLPQEAGLRDAVSFEKGCYVGQEPIVMLEHRGKPPRRLVHLASDAEISAGDALLQDGREVGAISSRALGPDGWRALAWVRRKALESGEALRVSKGPLRLLRVLGDRERPEDAIPDAT